MMYILYDSRRGYVVYDVNHKEVGFFISEQQAINFIYQNKQLNNMYYDNQTRSNNSLQNNHYSNNLKKVIEIENPSFKNKEVLNSYDIAQQNKNEYLDNLKSSNISRENIDLNEKLEKIQEQINQLMELNNNKNTIINDNKNQNTINSKIEEQSQNNSFRRYLKKFQNGEEQSHVSVHKNSDGGINSNSFLAKRTGVDNTSKVTSVNANQVFASQKQVNKEVPFIIKSVNNSSQKFSVGSNEEKNNFVVNRNNKISSSVNETIFSEKANSHKKFWIIGISIAILIIASIATVIGVMLI